ncbi:DUF5330 domain-containing protein [Pseudovibrio ascidiaceicola]|uniref:Uncharacterized protein n=1 Tax=Pseudovibrio ascidiaceicola TaxID=285279 RepID=A0A1I4DAF2_9HYPH|nr:DUF5330 domain-containing protein [Pseudovibrio ascidiaceicola]SFK90598.1 hypothetical protein SAMN04488518_11190 [Pseudovibrio ascidiaceicola]
MFFLLRTTFWIGLVLLLLPIGTGSDEDAPSIGIVQVYLAAQSTVKDLGGFCDRNPNACEMGGSVITLVGLKAKEAARLTYNYLSDSEAEDLQPTKFAALPSAQDAIEAIPFDEVAAGQLLPSLTSPSDEPAHSGTLSSADRDIPWQLNQDQQQNSSAQADPSEQGLFAEVQPIYATPVAAVPLPRPNPLYYGRN